MKKIISILLSAATIISLASCGKSEDSSAKFGCTIKVAPSENSATVSVEVNDASAEYQLWVVESSAYEESVPQSAKTLKGNASETFTGLKDDTEYIAAVYEASTGFKTKEFVTDKSTVTYESLQGSDYIVLALDDATRESIKGKIAYYMPSDGNYAAGDDRSQDTGTIFFDYWNGGSAGTCSGPNSYGVVDSWFSLNTASGWFGYCFRLSEGNSDEEKATSAAHRKTLQSITTDYTFHIAMKATCSGEYSLRVLSGEFGVTIGDENAKYGFKRDGQWHEIEIPMSVFMASDKYNATTETGIMAFCQGANGYPTTLDFDAVFFYKK